jgi:methylenetetrahydrofolate dehydrogenase (NADP+)/methenyltetrahydrofolate cyclohydrolase
MSKLVSLNGSDIAGFIKERQAASVRSMAVKPMLAIICTNSNPVTNLYLRIKQNYATEIGVTTEIYQITDSEAPKAIEELNNREDIHGIIVQLPLGDPSKTDDIVNAVSPGKDVDGLTTNSPYDPATPTAILWLLASYNIDFRDKKVLVIGQGRLVGGPLAKMLANSEVEVTIADDTTKNLKDLCLQSQIIITATGKARLISPDMVPQNAIIIDAGTSTDNSGVVGDVADEVRDRGDVVISPKRGGVGPLTVAALFENLLQATRMQASE